MNKRILKWNFIFQYGWVITNIINSIILLPLYLANIDTDTLGVWLATGAILTWMTLADPGVGDVLQQKIAEVRGRRDSREVGRLIGSGFIASGFILLLSILVGYVCYSFIGLLIHKEIGSYPFLAIALLLSVVATGLSLVSFSMSGINQGLHNSASVAICSVTANFLFLLVNLVFLFKGFGVLSIALANLARAVYINLYNIISMLRVLRKEQIKIEYGWVHFRRFSKIFSFTSASKIINGLAYSVDLLVLARFIAPSMITMYEINKRPINITYSLVGRHSVALMPLISHAKGGDNKASIIELINKHFRFYCYAAMFVVFIFCFNYENLITAWTGPGQFAGNFVVYLLITNLFFSLLSYFMSNVGYALGDIKRNSMFNIVRGCIYGVLMFFAAKYFGIPGTLVVSLAMTITVDLFFYNYRVYKLGYLDILGIKMIIRPWLIIIPVCLVMGWILRLLVDSLLPSQMHFSRLLINGGIFSMLFIAILLIADSTIRNIARQITGKYVVRPINKLFRLQATK